MSEYNFLVPEMAHDVIESSSFFWTTRIFDIICACIVLLALIYHIYVLYSFGLQNDAKSREMSRQQSKSKSIPNFAMTPSASTRRRACSVGSQSETVRKWTLILNTFTILYIFFAFITLFMLLLNIWSAFPLSYNCHTIVEILCTSFHLSKSFFYCIFISRLQVAFISSAYKYTPYQICSLFIFVAIYTIFLVFGTPFVIYGKWFVYKEYEWCHVHINEGTTESVGVLIWIMMDLIISIILLYLFEKPLSKLLKSVNNKNFKLARLVIKYLILTWASIIFSIIGFLLYLWKHITILIEIGAPFTIICVILMHVHYSPVFDTLCGKCAHSLVKRSKYYQKTMRNLHLDINTPIDDDDDGTKLSVDSGKLNTVIPATPVTPLQMVESIELEQTKSVNDNNGNANDESLESNDEEVP